MSFLRFYAKIRIQLTHNYGIIRSEFRQLTSTLSRSSLFFIWALGFCQKANPWIRLFWHFTRFPTYSPSFGVRSHCKFDADNLTVTHPLLCYASQSQFETSTVPSCESRFANPGNAPTRRKVAMRWAPLLHHQLQLQYFLWDNQSLLGLSGLF